MIAGASDKTNVRNIPTLIAENKTLAVSARFDRMTPNDVINMKPTVLTAAQIESLVKDGRLEPKPDSLTLEDLIYILLLNKELRSFKDSLQEQVTPAFNMATITAIKAAG
jgi:hypothetical protein